MYRTIETSFWTDPKIADLDISGKLFALYLVTNPHSHVGGLYHLPDVIVMEETGFSKRTLDTLWDTLSGAGFCRRDKKLGVVWVVNMFFYQAKGEKNQRSVAKLFPSLHKSFLINEFLQRYPEVKQFTTASPDTLSDRVSDRVSDVGAQEQEQKMDQDQDQNLDQKKKTKATGDSAFDVFWKVYPLRVGKGDARKAYAAAVKRLREELRGDEFDPDKFLASKAAEFAPTPKGTGEYCPYPSRWLNDCRYDDDPKEWGSTRRTADLSLFKNPGWNPETGELYEAGGNGDE